MERRRTGGQEQGIRTEAGEKGRHRKGGQEQGRRTGAGEEGKDRGL